ncbi:MAG: phenylalanine--tRNA ligase subunit beta [Candidatus Magasanikbacteria bacterium]|nr:phenylalanine--tRNA ligase subunit beta [Candidatus Magasanikbacteria bacterium]
MLISYQWLKKYVNLPDSITAEEVAARLKASTVEVENVEFQGKNLENVVVGKVLSAEKHPNADKLKLCKVDVGNEKLQIVCGGSNVVAGMLVALAKVGAKVKWHGEGELIELKPAKIRDVESAGMICASTEIGLAELFPLKDEKEIMDITHLKARPGTPLAQVLGLNDSVLEIDNKSLSNRPDLWGHYGIAREVAVLFNKNLKEYKTDKIKPGKGGAVKVEVENTKLCPRYVAVAVSGVKVGPSPEWLKKSLSAIGLRSINNIVDITNFVMMDLGQPLHAFDAAKVVDTTIVVRAAKDGEEFITLDGEKRKLDSSMLMIADQSKALAIAGVMGGLDSGITDQTNTIIFESANFDAASIRHTSTKLGLRSDASARFEKSLDPSLAMPALQKAVELVLQICPGAKVAGKVVEASKFSVKQGPIMLSMGLLEKKIGTKISKKEVERILTQLGFEVKSKGEGFAVKIPTWRATKDISIAEDLVEEILRMYGYDKIESSLPMFAINPPEENKLRKLEREVKNILANSLSYTEVYNYSFVSGEQIAKIGDDPAKYIALDNPLSKEKPYLRRCLLLNLLENLEQNQAGNNTLKLFEIGSVFREEDSGLRTESNKDSLLPGQDTWFTAVYMEKKNNTPFWAARGVVETLSKTILPGIVVSKSGADGFARHPSRSAGLMMGEKNVGSLYELHPKVGSNFGLEGRVGVVKINLSFVADLQQFETTYAPVPAFPAVERDLAIIVKKNIAHQDILSALLGADPLLQSVSLFDVYEGANVSAEYKSMAYHFIYRNNERTLVTEEVEKAHQKIIDILKKSFNAEVR